jgi:hypothetical protein
VSEQSARAQIPLVIDIVCGCSGRLTVEYNTNLTDTFKTSHAELLGLAKAWVTAQPNCQKGHPTT